MERTESGVRANVSDLLARCVGVVADAPHDVIVAALDGRIPLTIYRRPGADEWDLTMSELGLHDTGGGVASSLRCEEIVERLARLELGYTRPPRHVVDVSVMPMRSPADVGIGRVDLAALALFLDDISVRGVAEGIPDLQFLLGRAHGGSRVDIESLHGVTLDIDRHVVDPAAEHEVHGARMPAVAFATESGGARLLYATSNPFTLDDTDAMAARQDLLDELTLVFDGVDPRCHDPAQRQHLPGTIRTTKGPPRLVQYPAIHLAGDAIDLGSIRPQLPGRILTALGLTPLGVTTEERALVEHFLEQIGTPAPATKSVLVSRCPLKQHSSRKAYVNRRADGSISIHCLGDHGGIGSMQWSERDLLALALGGGT